MITIMTASSSHTGVMHESLRGADAALLAKRPGLHPGPYCFSVRMLKGGPLVPVKVWHGAPLDPVTGEPLDRSHRWNVLRNGRVVDDPYRVIIAFDGATGRPLVNATPISEDEHDYLLAVNRWAETHAPDAPEAAVTTPINKRAMRTIF